MFVARLTAGRALQDSNMPWESFAGMDREDMLAMCNNLLRHVAHLHALRERTGRTVALALEPEPRCFIETIEEAVTVFEEHLYAERAAAWLAERTGLGVEEAGEALRRHLGVCLDTCHAAVEMEDPRGCVESLRRAGIPIC